MLFHGIRTSIDKDPYRFVIFLGGLDPLSPNLDPSMKLLYIYKKKRIEHYCNTVTKVSIRNYTKISAAPILYFNKTLAII